MQILIQRSIWKRTQWLEIDGPDLWTSWADESPTHPSSLPADRKQCHSGPLLPRRENLPSSRVGGVDMSSVFHLGADRGFQFDLVCRLEELAHVQHRRKGPVFPASDDANPDAIAACTD
jgi:hypothetical protein